MEQARLGSEPPVTGIPGRWPAAALAQAGHPRLLERFASTRTRVVSEAVAEIGRTFSPHRLEVRRGEDRFEVRHNRVDMREVSINTLTYGGAEVVIDPGVRGESYVVMLPLSGSALVDDGTGSRVVDADGMGLLLPRTRCQMQWRQDCAMLLLRVHRAALEGRLAPSYRAGAGLSPWRSRRDAAVAAWCAAAIDVANGLDRFGETWLSHPAACASMEEFLLGAFAAMVGPSPGEQAVPRTGERCLIRAKEYIHAHLDSALRLDQIARHACVSPRTLEAAFKRRGEPSPLAYARRVRLESVHRALCDAARQGAMPNVTEVALRHGFVHMGRFAAQYRERFGCLPSETLKYERT